jgi:hypothetical protein
MDLPIKELKVIVAGGRDFNNYALLRSTIFTLVHSKLYSGYGISIVSGMARGADSLAVEFATTHNVKLYQFPADWATYGKAAGPIRNREMAKFADVLLAFWDGQSAGTRNMIDEMSRLRKRVHIVRYSMEPES